MRLVIVRSDASTNVSLASEQVFGDPVEVAAAIAGLYASGAVDDGSTYYALDLDASMPVVVVSQALPQDEPAQVEEPYAEAVLEEAATEEVAAEPLAVEAAPQADIEILIEPVDEAAAEAEAPVAEVEPGEWPWDLPAGEAEADPEAQADEEPAFADAPGASLAEDLVIVAEPAAEQAEEEPADGGEAALEEAQPLDLAADEEPAAEPVEALAEPEAESDAAPEEAVAESDEQRGIAEPRGVIDVDADASDEEAEAPTANDADPAYEPGILNMSQYTCDDCVYVNTCPNQHQKAPAECGSFQWRSV